MEETTEVREHERYQIIENAIRAADRIILDGSDGSEEETDYLTAMVAKKMIERALTPFQNEILQKDLCGKRSSPCPCD